MPINFDAALGNHEQALKLHARRLKVHAANMANADTPDYKARDIDFKAALTKARSNAGGTNLKTTHPSHMGGSQGNPAQSAELLYRTPNQSSLDGNTVDVQLEQSAFAETAVRYRASVQFLGGKFKGMMGALRGD
jgi:flagellar basal-body rod protein FlgB